MKKIISLILVIVLCFCSACSVTPEPEPEPEQDDGINQSNVLGYIVENESSDYTIVYGNSATPAESFAAAEMQLYIGKITNVYPEIVSESSINYSVSSTIISIGNTDILKSLKFGIDYSSLNTDGFVIKTHGKSMFISGASDNGTIYGVYDFLEKITNLKFLAADYTYIPSLDKIPLYELNIIEIPAFESRGYMSGSTTGTANVLNMVHLRMANEYTSIPDENGGGMSKLWYQGLNDMHNALEYVPTDVYYTAGNKTDNAHMYYIDGGVVKDICYTDGITADGKLDTSMPVSAAKVAIESLKSYVLDAVDSGSPCKYFMLGQMDLQTACNCARCIENTAKYYRSGNLIRFVNVVADEVQKWSDQVLKGREINIVTFAYQFTDAAPVKLDTVTNTYQLLDPTVKPRDNVCIRLAPIEASNYYSFSDESQITKYKAWFSQWNATGSNFMIWTYHTMFALTYFFYYPTMPSWQANFQDYQKMGVKYVLMQSSHTEYNDFKAIMEAYVASKLLWNPNRDVNALVEEFITYYYGDIVSGKVQKIVDNYNEHSALLANNKALGLTFVLWNPPLWSPQNQPLNYLLSQDKLANECLADINNSALDDIEKLNATTKIYRIKLMTVYMILLNYDYYYPNDLDGKEKLSREFFSIAEKLNVVQYAEGLSIGTLKNELLG